jgi:hypothetical protein
MFIRIHFFWFHINFAVLICSHATCLLSKARQNVSSGHGNDGRPSGHTRERAARASDVQVRVGQGLVGILAVLKQQLFIYLFIRGTFIAH